MTRAPDPARLDKTNRSHDVQASIRARILAGEFVPGCRLRLNDFVEDYGVSLSVVREAVTRLSGEGLVTASPKRGFGVTALSREDLLDLTRTRVVVETSALVEAIRLGDLAWEGSVVAAHHELANTPMLRPDGHVDSTAFASAHRAFHAALLQGCGSKRLTAIAAELRVCAELYQYWAREIAGDERDVAAEHRRIAELTIARDEAAATAALREHIEGTSAALVRYLEHVDATGSELSA